MTKDDFDALSKHSVDELKTSLKSLGCTVSGNKALLIKRLYLTKLDDEVLETLSELCETPGIDHKSFVQGLEKVDFQDKIEDAINPKAESIMVGDEEFDLLDEAIINEGDDDFCGSYHGSDTAEGSSLDDAQFVVLDDVEQDDGSGDMLEIDDDEPEEVGLSIATDENEIAEIWAIEEKRKAEEEERKKEEERRKKEEEKRKEEEAERKRRELERKKREEERRKEDKRREEERKKREEERRKEDKKREEEKRKREEERKKEEKKREEEKKKREEERKKKEEERKNEEKKREEEKKRKEEEEKQRVEAERKTKEEEKKREEEKKLEEERKKKEEERKQKEEEKKLEEKKKREEEKKRKEAERKKSEERKRVEAKKKDIKIKTEVKVEKIKKEDESGKGKESSGKKLTFCSVCNMFLTSSEAFDNHVKGPIHRDRLEQKKVPTPKTDSSSKNVKSESKDRGKEDRRTNIIKCELCNLHFPRSSSLKKHLTGEEHMKMLRAISGKGKKITDILINLDLRNHAEPLLGLEHLVERVMDLHNNLYIVYACKLCSSQKISERDIFPHIKGLRHRLNYLEKYYSSDFVIAMQEPESLRGAFVKDCATSIEKNKGRGKVTSLQLVKESAEAKDKNVTASASSASKSSNVNKSKSREDSSRSSPRTSERDRRGRSRDRSKSDRPIFIDRRTKAFAEGRERSRSPRLITSRNSVLGRDRDRRLSMSPIRDRALALRRQEDLDLDYGELSGRYFGDEMDSTRVLDRRYGDELTRRGSDFDDLERNFMNPISDEVNDLMRERRRFRDQDMTPGRMFNDRARGRRDVLDRGMLQGLMRGQDDHYDDFQERDMELDSGDDLGQDRRVVLPRAEDDFFDMAREKLGKKASVSYNGSERDINLLPPEKQALILKLGMTLGKQKDGLPGNQGSGMGNRGTGVANQGAGGGNRGTGKSNRGGKKANQGAGHGNRGKGGLYRQDTTAGFGDHTTGMGSQGTRMDNRSQEKVGQWAEMGNRDIGMDNQGILSGNLGMANNSSMMSDMAVMDDGMRGNRNRGLGQNMNQGQGNINRANKGYQKGSNQQGRKGSGGNQDSFSDQFGNQAMNRPQAVDHGTWNLAKTDVHYQKPFDQGLSPGASGQGRGNQGRGVNHGGMAAEGRADNRKRSYGGDDGLDQYGKRQAIGTKMPKDNRNVSVKERNTKCYLCEEIGHFARNCPDEDKVKFVQCNLCKQLGHLPPNCPAKKLSTPSTWMTKQREDTRRMPKQREEATMMPKQREEAMRMPKQQQDDQYWDEPPPLQEEEEEVDLKTQLAGMIESLSEKDTKLLLQITGTVAKKHKVQQAKQQQPLQRQQQPLQTQQQSMQIKQEPLQRQQQQPLQRQQEPLQRQQQPLHRQQEPWQRQQQPMQRQHEPLQRQQQPMQRQQEPLQRQQYVQKTREVSPAKPPSFKSYSTTINESAMRAASQLTGAGMKQQIQQKSFSLLGGVGLQSNQTSGYGQSQSFDQGGRNFDETNSSTMYGGGSGMVGMREDVAMMVSNPQKMSQQNVNDYGMQQRGGSSSMGGNSWQRDMDRF